MTKNNKQVKIQVDYKGVDYNQWRMSGVHHFKVRVVSDRKSYPIDFWQGFSEEFDQESFLDCITSDFVAVMQYGETIKSLCQNYLMLDCGLEEGSNTIKTATLMRDNYNKIKHAFYNEDDFKDWVSQEFQRINDC